MKKVKKGHLQAPTLKTYGPVQYHENTPLHSVACGNVLCVVDAQFLVEEFAREMIVENLLLGGREAGEAREFGNNVGFALLHRYEREHKKKNVIQKASFPKSDASECAVHRDAYTGCVGGGAGSLQ